MRAARVGRRPADAVAFEPVQRRTGAEGRIHFGVDSPLGIVADFVPEAGAAADLVLERIAAVRRLRNERQPVAAAAAEQQVPERRLGRRLRQDAVAREAGDLEILDDDLEGFVGLNGAGPHHDEPRRVGWRRRGHERDAPAARPRAVEAVAAEHPEVA